MREGQRTLVGILGCYFLDDASVLETQPPYAQHFPEVLEQLPWDFVEIRKAFFFGDPGAVRQFLEARRERHTAFVDLDGVVVEQRPHASTLACDNTLICNTLETLRAFRSQANRVVLVTARSSLRRRAVVTMLAAYDDIVFDCESGQRFLVNDLKPVLPWRPQAVAVNVARDQGLTSLPVDACRVLCEFEGGSFACTRLLQRPGELAFVRKIVTQKAHAQGLRRQAEDLRRLAFFCAGVVPEVLDEAEDDRAYWYDLSFFQGSRPLSEFPLEAPSLKLQ
jgi:hypothetical protein